MKNLILLLAVSISSMANSQVLSMEQYKDDSRTESTAQQGVKTKIENGYILKYDYMKWNAYDLGGVISECDRLLSENGKDIMTPDYDESTINLTTDNFYDDYLSIMIMSGESIRKAWVIENKSNPDTVFAVTMQAGYSGIELLVVELTK